MRYLADSNGGQHSPIEESTSNDTKDILLAIALSGIAAVATVYFVFASVADVWGMSISDRLIKRGNKWGYFTMVLNLGALAFWIYWVIYLGHRPFGR